MNISKINIPMYTMYIKVIKVKYSIQFQIKHTWKRGSYRIKGKNYFFTDTYIPYYSHYIQKISIQKQTLKMNIKMQRNTLKCTGCQGNMLICFCT